MSNQAAARVAIAEAGYTVSDVSDYLDRLRDSGVTNMFGAGPYLQENFGFNRADAKTVTLAYVLEGLGCD